MKKILLLCLLAGVLSVFTICNNVFSGERVTAIKSGEKSEVIEVVTSKPKGSYTLGVSLPHLRDPYWVGIAYGICQVAEKFSIKVILLSAGGYANIEKQVNQVEDLIVRKVDAIILSAVDGSALAPVTEKAVKNEIPVIDNALWIKSDKTSIAITNDDYNVGKLQAEYIGKKLKGVGNVVMLCGPAGAGWTNARYKGFKEAISKYPDIKILAERWCEMDRPTAMNIAEDAIQTFPDINFFYTAADLLGRGVCDAIIGSRNTGKMFVTSGGFTRGTVPYIKKGIMAMAVGESAIDNGKLAAIFAVKILNGESVPAKNIYVFNNVYTIENVNEMVAKGAPHEWFPKGWTPPR